MSRHAHRLILAAGWLIFLVLAYPGLLTLDSVDQLTEARAGFFTDGHPPAMGMLWRLLDAIVAGPILMLVLQVTTFLIGTYLVLRRAMSKRTAAIAASLVLLVPPIANPMAFIWKDSLMAGICMLGAGLVLSSCRRARLGSLVCFAVATAVKYNALAATLPLIVLAFEWTPGQHWLRRYALSTATWLGVTVAAMGANSLFVDQPMYFWHSSVAVSDIAGVIANSDTLTDEQLRRELDGTGLVITSDIQAHARAIDASRDTQRLVVGDARMWDLPFTGTTPAPPTQRAAIASAWWHFITGNPAAYARTRVGFFLDVLGVTYKSHGAVPPRIMKYSGFLTNLGLSTTSWWVQNRWSSANKAVWRHTPLFTPWLYLLLTVLALAALRWIGRGQRDVLALLASGLVAELSLLPLVVSPDFRYSHWTITTTVVALVMLIARRVAAARGTAGTPAASPHV